MKLPPTSTARQAVRRVASNLPSPIGPLARGIDALRADSRTIKRRLARSEAQLTEIAATLEQMRRTLDQAKLSASAPTGPHEAVTNLFTNSKIYVDTRDLQLAPHLMLDGRWERGVTAIFCRNLTKPDAVIFDVGANFGYYGFVAAHECRQGTIHFFEPNPDLVRCIRRSIAVNVLRKRAFVAQTAVGAGPGQARLVIPGDYLGSSSMQLTENDLVNQVTADEIEYLDVPMTSLDDYVAQHSIPRVDVMKIDVEGLEPDVYAGMKGILANNPDLFLLLEFSIRRYSDPAGFFEQLLRDFANVYHCDGHDLAKVSSLEDMREEFDRNGLVMLACSNNLLQ